MLLRNRHFVRMLSLINLFPLMRSFKIHDKSFSVIYNIMRIFHKFQQLDRVACGRPPAVYLIIKGEAVVGHLLSEVVVVIKGFKYLSKLNIMRRYDAKAVLLR